MELQFKRVFLGYVCDSQDISAMCILSLKTGIRYFRSGSAHSYAIFEVDDMVFGFLKLFQPQ